MNSIAIADLQSQENNNELQRFARSIKGKMFRVQLPNKTMPEGKRIFQKITDIEQDITKIEIYTLVKQAIEKMIELYDEKESLLQNINELNATDLQKVHEEDK